MEEKEYSLNNNFNTFILGFKLLIVNIVVLLFLNENNVRIQ